MTEPGPDLDQRLARLAERRTNAGSKPADASAPGSSSALPSSSAPAPPAPGRVRRRHPAAAARVLSVGLSSSAFLSIVAAFGTQSNPSGALSTGVTRSATASSNTSGPPPTVRTKIVVRDVHHVIYVDQYGRPVPPPTMPKGSPVPGAGTGGHGSGAAKPGSGSSSRLPTAPNNAPTGLPAATGPTVTQPVAHVGSGPVATAPPAPGPSIPTPPRPSSPTTVVTAPPPPPPPPACSGTKCP